MKMLCESLNWPFTRLQHLKVVFPRHWTSKPALCAMHESQNGSNVTYQINIANSSFETLRDSRFQGTCGTQRRLYLRWCCDRKNGQSIRADSRLPIVRILCYTARTILINLARIRTPTSGAVHQISAEWYIEILNMK